VRRALAAVAVAALAIPEAALACPTCVSSAFGDRTFNWAYLALILMPFALTAVVGGLLAVRSGWLTRARIAGRLSDVKAWFGQTSRKARETT
jgi:hypothetical protein